MPTTNFLAIVPPEHFANASLNADTGIYALL